MMEQTYNRPKLHSKHNYNYFQNTFWKPHFITPKSSLSLYSPRQMRTHFLQTNEYAACRRSKETYEMAKNTHEKKNVGMIGVTGWVMIKMWGLAGLVEGPNRLEIAVLLCLFLVLLVHLRGFFRFIWGIFIWQNMVFIVPIIGSEMWLNLVCYFVPEWGGYFRGYFAPCLNVNSWHDWDVVLWGSLEGYRETLTHEVIHAYRRGEYITFMAMLWTSCFTEVRASGSCYWRGV